MPAEIYYYRFAIGDLGEILISCGTINNQHKNTAWAILSNRCGLYIF